MRIKLYQIDTDRDTSGICFMSHDYAEKHGWESSIYNMTFSGDVKCNSLEEVFSMFNSPERPETFMGRSLSVSDVVETEVDGEMGFFYCNSIGFQKVDFDPELTQTRYKEMMDVVILEPGKRARIGQIGVELSDMQAFVQGYIQAVYPFGEIPACIVCNEEAKLEKLPLNRALRLNMDGESESAEIYDIIAGNCFICGLTEDSFGSLSKSDLQKFKQQFDKPEIFVRNENGIESIKVDESTYTRAMRHR